MLQEWFDPETQVPRSPSFWLVMGGLVLVQVVALWSLCSDQVNRAEARVTEFRMQQTALADCLQYIPGSTVASCTQRVANPSHQQPAVTQVSYTFR
jgi:hypothetical protein